MSCTKGHQLCRFTEQDIFVDLIQQPANKGEKKEEEIQEEETAGECLDDQSQAEEAKGTNSCVNVNVNPGKTVNTELAALAAEFE